MGHESEVYCSGDDFYAGLDSWYSLGLRINVLKLDISDHVYF